MTSLQATYVRRSNGVGSIKQLVSVVVLALFVPWPLPAGQGHHDHGETVDVSGLAYPPHVSVEATRDGVTGWNIQVRTTNFRFAPERVNQTHVAGEGHAHLYVDGKKVARLYGPWFHLPILGKGTHELRVTLTANDHAAYSVNGELIEATIWVQAQ